MTVYRVGNSGAVVFTSEGAPLVRLTPGQYVVPGTETTMTLSDGDGVEILEPRLRTYLRPGATRPERAPHE